ncbi:unnamed protein product [Ectocarpus sp. CCAP 1310/34]|nr:unnamed protein product [Ectocarpus sp. CCAP 1310/34]
MHRNTMGGSTVPTAAPASPPPRPPPAAAPATPRDRGALLAALSDALAGALGSVVAVAVFYPIDIAKTRAQASSPVTTRSRHDHDESSGGYDSNTEEGSTAPGGGRVGSRNTARAADGRRRVWFRSRTLAALLSIVRTEGGLPRLYEGIEAKVLQALLGSFVYFYAYAFIKGLLRRRAAGGGSGGGASKPLRPSLNLLAAAMAGAVNQAFTLPLENITTRMQTAPQCTPSVENNDGEGAGGRGGHGAMEGSSRLDGRRCGVGNDTNGRWRDPVPAMTAKVTQTAGDNQAPIKRGQRRPRQSVAAVTGELYREGGGLGRFWRGFTPSLILTCNPAINYTAFDILKALWLRRRDAAATAAGTVSSTTAGASAVGTSGGGTDGFLNPLEAFLVAAAAKSLATLVTYPLIRAKVVLMTSPSSPSAPIVDRRSGNCSSPAVPPAASASQLITPKGHVFGSCGSGRIGEATDEGSYGGDERLSNNGEDRSAAAAAAATRMSDRGGSGHPIDASFGSAAAESTVAASSASAVDRGEGTTGGEMHSMATVLVDIFRREGIGGLYAGCGAQLLHTILKSALLLATKEQIARAAASAVFLGGSSRGRAAGFAKPPAASR